MTSDPATDAQSVSSLCRSAGRLTGKIQTSCDGCWPPSTPKEDGTFIVVIASCSFQTFLVRSQCMESTCLGSILSLLRKRISNFHARASFEVTSLILSTYTETFSQKHLRRVPCKERLPTSTVHRSINQSINQSAKQSANQPTNQPINQSTNQSINQPTNQSISQSVNHQGVGMQVMQLLQHTYIEAGVWIQVCKYRCVDTGVEIQVKTCKKYHLHNYNLKILLLIFS